MSGEWLHKTFNITVLGTEIYILAEQAGKMAAQTQDSLTGPNGNQISFPETAYLLSNAKKRN